MPLAPPLTRKTEDASGRSLVVMMLSPQMPANLLLAYQRRSSLQAISDFDYQTIGIVEFRNDVLDRLTGVQVGRQVYRPAKHPFPFKVQRFCQSE